MRSLASLTTCVQPVYGQSYNRRTTAQLTHSTSCLLATHAYKPTSYTSTAGLFPRPSFTFFAQLFEHFNRLNRRLVPIFHSPYKNKDFLNIYNFIIER